MITDERLRELEELNKTEHYGLAKHQGQDLIDEVRRLREVIKSRKDKPTIACVRCLHCGLDCKQGSMLSCGNDMPKTEAYSLARSRAGLRKIIHYVFNRWGESAVFEEVASYALSSHKAGIGEYPAHDERWLVERGNREVGLRDE